MPTLGVVMIVKDEAHRLADCLQSVIAITDEIVIGDTGSTDNTVEVAEKFFAKVLPVKWHDDFAEARNRVLYAASADWQLHLDADEMLDAEGAARIRAIVDADGEGADAIELTLANYCDTPRAWRWVPVRPNDPMARGYSGYVEVGLLRLFRGRKGFRYSEPVYESIAHSVVKAGAIIRAEPVLIHHYGYEAGPSEKGRLYLKIALKKVQKDPNNAKAWHDFAELLLAFNRSELAEEAVRRALEAEPRHLGAATTLGTILLNRGDVCGARTLFEELEADGISPPHIVTALAAIAIRQGRIDDALARCEAVLEAAPNTIMARLYYARALDLSRRVEEARGQLEAALAIAPSLTELQDRLKAHRLREDGVQERAAGKLQDALGTLVQALKHDSEDPVVYYHLGLVMQGLGQHAAAEKSFTRAELLAPSLSELRPPPREEQEEDA